MHMKKKNPGIFKKILGIKPVKKQSHFSSNDYFYLTLSKIYARFYSNKEGFILSLNGLSGLDFGNLQLANNSVYVIFVVQNYNSFNGFF